MKIILKKDVQGLGYKDDVLTVKDGYGRNYLLPQGFAVIATEKAVKMLNEELKQRAHKLAKIIFISCVLLFYFIKSVTNGRSAIWRARFTA